MEYERVKKEAEQALEDVWHNYYNLDFFQEAVKRILSLVEIKSDDQSLPESKIETLRTDVIKLRDEEYKLAGFIRVISQSLKGSEYE